MTRLRELTLSILALILASHAHAAGQNLSKLETLTVQVLEQACKNTESQAQMQAAYEILSPDFDANRDQYLRSMRHRFKESLRVVLYEATLDLEMTLAKFANLDGEDDTLRESCASIEQSRPRKWHAIERRQQEIAEMRDDLRRSTQWWQSYYQTLLMATYEIQVLEKIILTGHWKGEAFWPRDVAKPGIAFPPIYPQRAGMGIMGTAERRLAYLFHMFPVLKQPARRSFGLATQTLADVLYEEVFLKARGRPSGGSRAIRNSLIEDLAPVLEEVKEFVLATGTDASEIEGHREELQWTDQRNAELSQTQQFEFLIWQLFLNDRLRDIIVDRVAVVENMQELVRRQIKNVTREWRRQLREARKIACRDGTDYLESMPNLIPVYFQNNPSDPYRMAYLDTYCHTRWGQTWRKTLEAAADVTAVGTFIVGVGTGQIWLLGISGGLAASSFLSKGLRGVQNHALESAILNPSITERNVRNTSNALHFALAPVAAVGAVWGGSTMAATGGWRYFWPMGAKWTKTKLMILGARMLFGTTVSSIARIKRGINPIKDPGFIISIFENYLLSVSFVNIGNANNLAQFVRNLGVDAAMGLTINHFVQSGYFLASGSEPDARILEFAANWNVFPSIPRKAFLYGLYYTTEWALGKGSGASVALQGIITVLDIYVTVCIGSNTYLRFMEDRESSYLNALLSTQLDDFNPFSRIPEEESPIDVFNYIVRMDYSDFMRLRRAALKYRSDFEPGIDTYLGMRHKLMQHTSEEAI